MSILIRGGRLVLASGSGFRWQGEIPYNPRPLDISLAPTVISEGAPPGTVVGTISVTDPGDTIWSWTITNQSVPGLFGFPTGATFNGGNTTIVAKETVPAYDVSSTHTITVRASDPAGGSVEEDLTIGVIPVAGDSIVADTYFAPLSGSVLGVAEASPADLNNAIGSFNLSNPSTGISSGYTWSITAQSVPGLFALGNSFNGSASVYVHLAQTMPAWSSATQTQSVTVKATDPSGNFFNTTIEIPVLRNGPAARLYPLDGYTITEGIVGPIGSFAAAGSVNQSYSYAVVGDDRFSFSGNRLHLSTALMLGSYNIAIRVTNSAGSETFQRSVTVNDVASAPESEYVWVAPVQEGIAPPADYLLSPQTLRIRNESSGALAANQYVTFSLSFPPGAVAMNQRPSFTVGGVKVTAQIDGYRYWHDAGGNRTSFQGGRFCLKIPQAFSAGEIKDITVGLDTASSAEFSTGFNNEFAKSNTTVTMDTPQPRSLAQARAAVVGKGYRVRANIDGTAYTATLTQAVADDTRTLFYGAGMYGHGFRCMSTFKNNSTSTDHPDIFVIWYAWVYDTGITEVMPVIHNSWYGGRADHTLTSVLVERTLPSVLVLSTWAGPISHYGHSIWFAGDAKARPLRDDGTPDYLHADYSQMLPMLAAAGVWPKYANNFVPPAPSPANPSHVPCGKTFAPANPASGALANCNYGNAIGPMPDWCARYVMTGDSAWLNVCRVVAADWGVWPYYHTDPGSADTFGCNNGWVLGVQNAARYAPMAVSNWALSSSQRTGLDANPSDIWTQSNFANPWFVVAYATGRKWWIDALAQGANWAAASGDAAGPTTNHRGYRYWRLGGKQYFTSPLQSEIQAACVMSAISGAEFLHSDADIRRAFFQDLLRDPYAALVDWTINDKPRQFSNDVTEHNTSPAWRPHGHAFLRNTTAFLPELDLWALTIAIDVLRHRWWLEPYVNKWAQYYLHSLVYGRAVDTASGGAGCGYWATLDEFKFRTSPTDSDNDIWTLEARGWKEIAYRWRAADWKIHPVAPGHAHVLNNVKAWYGSTRAFCRSDSFREPSGGYQSGKSPAIARGAAQVGALAGIGNAEPALSTYTSMQNYTIDPNFYRANGLDRWFIVP